MDNHQSPGWHGYEGSMAQEYLTRAQAAEADAVECRKERAAYGDNVAGKLSALENEVERLRELNADRAETAECELGLMTAAYDSQTLNLENAKDRIREGNAEVERLRAQVVTMANLLDKASALYADDWPAAFEDEVQATLEVANDSQDAR